MILRPRSFLSSFNLTVLSHYRAEILHSSNFHLAQLRRYDQLWTVISPKVKCPPRRRCRQSQGDSSPNQSRISGSHRKVSTHPTTCMKATMANSTRSLGAIPLSNPEKCTALHQPTLISSAEDGVSLIEATIPMSDPIVPPGPKLMSKTLKSPSNG